MDPVTLPPNPKICVLMLRQIGDVLLVTPLLAALRQKWPTAHITAVVNEITAPMLENNPDLNELWKLSKGKSLSVRQKFARQIQLLRRLSKARFDVTLDCTSGDRSAFYTFLTRASVRLGYTPRAHFFNWKESAAYTSVVPRPSQFIHQTARNLNLARDLGVKSESPRLVLRLTDEELAWAKAHRMKCKEKVILAHFVANWLFKCWEDQKAAALIDRLESENYSVWFTSGPVARERARAEEILKLCKHPPTAAWIGNISLRQLAALIATADMFVGVDTAPMHMAAALDVPLVALFGPTSAEIWRPWSDKALVLQKDCSCSRGKKICEKRSVRECMKSISVEEAFDAIKRTEAKFAYSS